MLCRGIYLTTEQNVQCEVSKISFVFTVWYSLHIIVCIVPASFLSPPLLLSADSS